MEAVRMGAGIREDASENAAGSVPAGERAKRTVGRFLDAACRMIGTKNPLLRAEMPTAEDFAAILEKIESLCLGIDPNGDTGRQVADALRKARPPRTHGGADAVRDAAKDRLGCLLALGAILRERYEAAKEDRSPPYSRSGSCTLIAPDGKEFS